MNKASLSPTESSLISQLRLDGPKERVNSAGLASYILRATQGRSDLAQAILTLPHEDFLSRIERVRTAIALGDLDEAERYLGPLIPASPEELSECLLEAARIALAKSQLGSVLELTQQALQMEETAAWTRMTLFQIRGDALLSMEKDQDAICELKKAIALSELFPKASSAVSARAFLVVAQVRAGHAQEAERELKALYGVLEQLKGQDVWLDRLCTVLRAEIHFLRKFSGPGPARKRLEEAREISRWLGDRSTEEKCARELAEISEKSDPVVKNYLNWTLLPRLNLVLTYAPRSILHLDESPVTKKILFALMDSPMKLPDLFELVWNLSFVRERHDTHLRATLSKVRKLLPAGALQVVDGQVSLR